ncbi:hypothetical protein [Brevundimonas sp. PAMC22021]|uniref:hypothetical protein n=1 Tax=Brevundimonas sp. PAMC22021 TaxID=2861285 RepID=UPI001C630BD6|nr:hypothetical protein [Brevundimonas sp. PAMC22021]QYF87414.1 hypothetical protein KY493_02600 [Brevundimonas sp. PAMC22021]
MFKVLIPTVAALGLVAFTAQTQEASAPAQPGMAWHLVQEGDMAKLAYGMANSDQLAMMITCSPGDRTAVVYGDVQPVGARVATSAPTPMDPMSGGDADEARIAVDDANLADLAHRGALRVSGEGGETVLTATTAERRGVRGFLSYCGSARA